MSIKFQERARLNNGFVIRLTERQFESIMWFREAACPEDKIIKDGYCHLFTDHRGKCVEHIRIVLDDPTHEILYNPCLDKHVFKELR